MKDLNEVKAAGYIGQDPELRYTGNGTAVANTTIALRRSWKKGDEWQSDTTWVGLVIWGKEAERFKQRVRKGSRVILGGRLQISKWDDKEGRTRYKTEILVEWWEMVAVESKDSSSGGRSVGDDYATEPTDGSDDDIPF